MKFNFVHFKKSQCTVYLDWICSQPELRNDRKIGLVCLLYISSSSKLNYPKPQNSERW